MSRLLLPRMNLSNFKGCSLISLPDIPQFEWMKYNKVPWGRVRSVTVAKDCYPSDLPFKLAFHMLSSVRQVLYPGKNANKSVLSILAK